MVDIFNIMCFSLNLRINVFRVASKANPADLPSKGKNPPRITNKLKTGNTPIKWKSSERSESNWSPGHPKHPGPS